MVIADALPAMTRTDDEAPTAAGHGEAALVARAKRDRRAFAPLYARYLTPVYRYCVGCLGSREAAEDATSLVFAKALAALPGCRDDAFRAWLFAIAHNVVADARRRGRPGVPIEAAIDLRDPAPTPEEAVLALDDDRSLAALLARLPDDQRRIVELRLAGLTGPEIARALGRSQGAVRVAQFRAYARLRSVLDGADDPERRSQ